MSDCNYCIAYKSIIFATMVDANINTAVQKTDTYTIEVHTEMLLHGKVVIFLIL